MRSPHRSCRSQHHSDVRPAVMYALGKSQAVDSSWHMNVREEKLKRRNPPRAIRAPRHRLPLRSCGNRHLQAWQPPRGEQCNPSQRIQSPDDGHSCFGNNHCVITFLGPACFEVINKPAAFPLTCTNAGSLDSAISKSEGRDRLWPISAATASGRWVRLLGQFYCLPPGAIIKKRRSIRSPEPPRTAVGSPLLRAPPAPYDATGSSLVPCAGRVARNRMRREYVRVREIIGHHLIPLDLHLRTDCLVPEADQSDFKFDESRFVTSSRSSASSRDRIGAAPPSRPVRPLARVARGRIRPFDAPEGRRCRSRRQHEGPTQNSATASTIEEIKALLFSGERPPLIWP